MGRPVIKLGVPLKQHLATAIQRVERGGILCAHLDGFDLHGRVAFRAAQRDRIEDARALPRKAAAPHDRLEKRADGRYLLRLKTRFRDGTTHLLFEPVELMERLAAQIPKPRINLVLYSGVLAPNAKLRAEAVRHARPAPAPEPPATETQTRAERETWSELMRLTYGLDVLACPRCGGRMKHLGTILDPRAPVASCSTWDCPLVHRRSCPRSTRRRFGKWRTPGFEALRQGARTSVHGCVACVAAFPPGRPNAYWL